MVVASREISYTQNEIITSTYSMIQRLPIQSVPLNSIGGGEVIDFILAPGAYNLSRFVLRYQTSNPAAGALLNNYEQIGGMNAYSLQLLSRNGVQIVYVPDVDVYSRLAATRQPLTDMLSADVPLSTAANAAALNGFVPGANTALTTAPTYSDSSSGPNLKGYVSRRLILAGGVNAVQFLEFQQKFGDMAPDTLFGQDMTILFPEEMTLRIILGPATNYNWAANASLTANNIPGVALTLSNLQLYCCVEKNIQIIQDLQNAVKSPGGFRLKVPYVIENKQAMPAVTAHSTTFRIGAGYGKKIHKIYTAAFVQPQTMANVYNFSQSGATAVISYWNSSINSQTLESYQMTVPLLYLEEQQKLKGCVINNYDDFVTTFVIVKSFTSNEDGAESFRGRYESSGLVLEPSTDLVYSIQLTLTAGTALTYYQFAVVEKELVIDSNGIRLEV